MEFLDKHYLKKFYDIKGKVDALNERNIEGYPTFGEYVLSDEIMISYFEQLKKIERKFSRLTVDDSETFYKHLFDQLNEIYQKCVNAILKNDKSRFAYNSLDELEQDVLRSFGHGCDEQLKIIYEDLQSKKVNNAKTIEKSKAVEKKSVEKPTIKINKNYKLPTIDILDKPMQQDSDNQSDIDANIKKLEEVLQEFDITGKVVSVCVGPSITQYELALKPGFRIKKLMSIDREIGLAMAKKDVRIIVPLPGKSTVGIEMANDKPATVYIKQIMESYSDDEKTRNNKLLIPLGKNLIGEVKYCDLNLVPHLLIAGETGSGKSIFIDSLIASLLIRSKPDEIKLLLIDPKKVELSMYNGVPHLIRPVVTDPKKGSVALQLIVREIEHRFDVLEQFSTKSIETYNELVDKKNKTLSEEQQLMKMPYIVVIIDEIADLMMVAGKEVEDSIMRITQLARAAGIHLIIATQSLNKEVITGLIKASIPARIAFDVASADESRAIIDIEGAEKLLGKGDMLYLTKPDDDPIRIQGAWINENEIHRVVDYVCNQQKANYDLRFENLETEKYEKTIELYSDYDEEYDDPLYNEIVDFVVQIGKASPSLLQRRFKLGYNRAARVMDLLEERGIVGPATGNSKPREVLVKYGNDDDGTVL